MRVRSARFTLPVAALSLALLGAGKIAAAQDPTLTPEEAVTLALRNNPRLAAAVQDVTAAGAGVRSARALTNPSLTFTPALFGTGSDEELLFQQPLELNGTRSARTGVAKAQLQQSRAAALTELRTLVFDTRVAYVELARAQELRALAQQVVQTAEEVHRGVSRQAQEGLRPEIDPVQTEIEVNRSRQQTALAEGQVAVARAALNTLLGRMPGEPFVTQPLEAIGAQPVEKLEVEALVAQALPARSEITAATAVREQFLQEGRLARAEGKPDLAPQLRSESVLRSPRQPGVGIGITLPFLDHGSRRNRVRQTEAAAQAQESRIAAARNQVRQEVEQAVSRLRAADQVVHGYQTGVLQQSRRLLDASLRALQLGAPGASILTALEAQRTYRAVLTEYTNALATVAQSRADLERATGAVPATLLPTTSPEKGTSR